MTTEPAEKPRQYSKDTLGKDTETLLAIIQEEFYHAPPIHIIAMMGLLVSSLVIACTPDPAGQRAIADGFHAAFLDSIEKAASAKRKQAEEDDGA